MIKVEGLTKIYGAIDDPSAGGIRNASFDLPVSSFFALLGPSGCGKTTTLRCIAGLETPDEGTIIIGDEIVFCAKRDINVPLNKRQIGMVFQSYAIWPHMTVFGNVAFPLTVDKNRKRTKSEISKTVAKALETVGLGDFSDRPASRLSGGQQQRVALARAIIGEPRLLLLDEPLSNLDAMLREDMRMELKRLQQQIGITAVYVTHDQSEALAMSDKIAVIDQGRIVQIDTPDKIYNEPCNRFVANFVGATNLIDDISHSAVKAGALGVVKIATGEALKARFLKGASAKDAVALSIRPEAVKFDLKPKAKTPAGQNRITGVVVSSSFLGDKVRYQIDIGAGNAKFQVLTQPGNEISTGEKVTLSFAVADTLAVPVN